MHGHGHGHEKHASTSSSLNGANVWGQGQQSDAFPGTGYPLVQMPSAQSAIDMKGKGRAIEEEGDGEDADMGVTGRIQVWANVMDTSKGRDKVLVRLHSIHLSGLEGWWHPDAGCWYSLSWIEGKSCGGVRMYS